MKLEYEEQRDGSLVAEVAGYRVTLYPDDTYTWQDVLGERLGTIVTWLRNYRFDEHGPEVFGSVDNFWDWADAQKALVLPFYLFEHGSIRVSTSPERFAGFDPVGWDWGQAGFVYATREKVLQQFRRKRLTDRVRKAAIEVMRQEIKLLDDILANGLWGLKVEGPDGTLLESLSGYSYRDALNAVEEALETAIWSNVERFLTE